MERSLLARIDSAPWLLVAAAAVLVAVNLAVIRRQSAVFTWLMLLGALILLVGAAAWAAEFATSRVVPSWIAFFVLTIVAERLELSRMVRTPRWASLAVGVLCLMLAAGAISTLVDEDTPESRSACRSPFWACGSSASMPHVARCASRVCHASQGSACSPAPRGLSQQGSNLAISGLPPAGPRYDAVVHAVMVGFVLGMVFAHAPIILPAVARVRVTYHRVLYAPLVLLHATLSLRLAGDLFGSALLRQAGGLGNALSLLVFAVAVMIGNRLGSGASAR